ncbi:MAG: hypothetical protein V2I33_23940 [Kangiellaceae bacterium]|jgi:hypothetical protein|nr:hypothetical protein [Kangiellaceae bacterium]
MGDEPGIHYINTMKDYVSNLWLNQCNSYRRYTQECLDTMVGKPDYNRLMNAKIRFENFPTLVGNDVCVKQTFTSFYWNYACSMAIAAAIFSVLA